MLIAILLPGVSRVVHGGVAICRRHRIGTIAHLTLDRNDVPVGGLASIFGRVDTLSNVPLHTSLDWQVRLATRGAREQE